MKVIGQVQRVERPSIEEFQESYFVTNKPVVLGGMASEWQARSALTPENLKEKFGDVIVPVRESDNELDVFFGPARRKTMRLREYVDLICGSETFAERPPYLANISFDDPRGQLYLRRIKKLLAFPDYFRNNTGSAVCLWVAAPGQKSTIHNDNYHNLNAQIYGKKSYLLFPPEQDPILYTEKINDTCWASHIDPQTPDLEKYPLFKDAEAIEAILGEGDMLYIPIFWFHQAFARSVSISTNMFVNVGEVRFWNK
jgi:jumonji domain-containing protein 7